MELSLFMIFSCVAAVSGIFVVLHRNPVYSALFLLVQLLCLVVIYALLHAYLIAIIQLLVYAGAIIVLFLFAIMILNPEEEQGWFSSLNFPKLLALFVGTLGLLACLLVFIKKESPLPVAEALNATDNAKAVGRLLYGKYLFPFEIVSVLLLIAILGVTVLAKKGDEDSSQKGNQS